VKIEKRTTLKEYIQPDSRVLDGGTITTN